MRRIGGEDAFWMQPRCSITRTLRECTYTFRRVIGFGIVELWDSGQDDPITAICVGCRAINQMQGRLWLKDNPCRPGWMPHRQFANLTIIRLAPCGYPNKDNLPEYVYLSLNPAGNMPRIRRLFRL